MLNSINSIKKITVQLLVTVIFLYACNPISKVYHNVTARFNPYFLAYQKNLEIKKIIQTYPTDDFDYILSLFPAIDQDKKTTVEKLADEQIKKASLSIQRHPGSRWTDNCFLLIAQGRLYMHDYKNAIETFKYINTKAKDEHIKHQSLLGLMRVFIDSSLFTSAIATVDYLRKEKLNTENINTFNLLKAHYFITKKEYKKAEPYLENVISTSPNKKYRARWYFINGQLHQLRADDKNARINYEYVLKSHPSYALRFYAQLNLASVTEVSNSSDIRWTQKSFKRLLKDIRNEEFQDKIYYEMAKFELKQDHIPKTMEYLQLSIQKSQKNKKQKGLSYLKFGEIYYEKLKKYTTAKLYYDSAATNIPKTEAIFEKTLKRQLSLAEFVKQFTIVTEEDSLQQLGKMDSIKLYRLLDDMAEKKNKEKDLLLTKKQQGNSSSYTTLNTSTNSPEEGTWYFYTPIAISQGKTTFTSIWGNRALEDNWRRSTKESIISFNSDTKIGDTLKTKTVSDKITRADLLRNIPRTKEDFEKSDERLQEAYFQLGKIYHQELEETKNAIQTFEKSLERYPQTKHHAETLYYLYLLYAKEKNTAYQDRYKKLVLETYPNSVWANLINNPSYLSDTKRSEELLDSLYKVSFQLYTEHQWPKAEHYIDSVKNLYPKNLLIDKFAFLQALITIQQEDASIYKIVLKEFIQSYPDSPLSKQAQQLLQTADKLPEGVLRKKEKKEK